MLHGENGIHAQCSEAPSLRHTASDAVNSFATARMGTVEKENTGQKKMVPKLEENPF